MMQYEMFVKMQTAKGRPMIEVIDNWPSNRVSGCFAAKCHERDNLSESVLFLKES